MKRKHKYLVKKETHWQQAYFRLKQEWNESKMVLAGTRIGTPMRSSGMRFGCVPTVFFTGVESIVIILTGVYINICTRNDTRKNMNWSIQDLCFFKRLWFLGRWWLWQRFTRKTLSLWFLNRWWLWRGVITKIPRCYVMYSIIFPGFLALLHRLIIRLPMFLWLGDWLRVIVLTYFFEWRDKLAVSDRSGRSGRLS